jgi:integrase/recombinase XerD
VSERIASFLRFLGEERGLSVNTLSAYQNDLRQFEQYLDSERFVQLNRSAADHEDGFLAEASREDLVAFFLSLRERGYSPATIARKMAAVKAVFHYLLQRGVISTNPAVNLGSPEVKKPLPRAIPVSDVDTLIRQASTRSSPEGLRDAAMLQVLCSTGMRVSELVSLEIEDLNIAERCLFCTGRNARRRELPLPDQAIAALEIYLHRGRPFVLNPDHGTSALFLNHRGRRLTRQGFWLIMKAMARRSGLANEVTPHTLRHSFAAHCLRDGVNLGRLRELLGHANISTTQIYTQVQLEPERSATTVRGDPVGASS